jgi:cytochrome c553
MEERLMKNTLALLILGICSGALSGQALAADAAAGKEKAAQVCASCHGADGHSTDPQYPLLAGQYGSYIVQALKEYQNGNRKNPIMGGFAAGLSEVDIANLAAWFSSQSGLVTPAMERLAEP